VCVGQPRGVLDGGQFKVYSSYKQLRDQKILQKLVLRIKGVICTPYIIKDLVYPI
jgi:hypothetical protein